ncbi:MAG TPA: sugar ABC transporter permease [Candidatus Limivivens intestinipullorum]|uniref:Sugar ABC transporter permease n=1 Tax=Candidatus Limivivens intestinipullorum TaxID=2840858 RepID=A0A9D1ES72_9FIRM|nr:sugar ABC transporter permease [Candidatus Limivivens intestinipullorum]
MRFRRKRLSSEAVSKYVFLFPGLCFFTFAIVVPFFMGINIAFTDWDGIAKDYEYVGFHNFLVAFQDKRLWVPIMNTLEFAFWGVIGNTVVSLGLALLVNARTGKLSVAARTVFYIPCCFSAILTAFLWNFLYKEIVTEIFAIKNPLGMPKWVIICIVIMQLWNTSGINMMIYLSGLKNIPSDLYEAATVDGATAFQKFGKITLPLLMPAFTVCITLALTSFMKEFALPLSSTGGGPAGASRTISIYIYENLYRYNKAGYGEAISMMFVIFLVLLSTAIQSFFRKREVEI